jgi:hypothetical protein
MDGSRRKVRVSKFEWRWGERMQFSSSSGNNDLRCKRFDKLNSNKKTT